MTNTATMATTTTTVRLQPAAKGTTTFMSEAEAQVIREATGGTIRRGRGVAAASISSLIAMARRGFVELDHPIRPRGATVTELGRRVARQLAN